MRTIDGRQSLAQVVLQTAQVAHQTVQLRLRSLERST